MFTIPLQPRLDIEQFKKRAKELVKAANASDPDALNQFARAWVEAMFRRRKARLDDPSVAHWVDQTVAEIVNPVREALKRSGERFALAQAQFLIANLHGFPTWSSFVDELRRGGLGTPFEEAASMVVAGNIEKLTSLLVQDRGLVRARSERTHRATLLHYVAANGVEDYRQQTPAKAVEVARVLLDAGAEVDALAETYGGGRQQTTMNLLVSSAHPDIAGLQGALAEVLLDHGAAIEGLDDDGSPLQTALAFGYLRTAETLVRRGARIGNITVAAALGRLDLVKQFVAGELPEPTESLLKLYWSGVPRDRALRQKVALHWAAHHGRTDVVKYFLSLGMDPASTDDNKMNLLHNATSGPHLELVRYLLGLNVIPLENENVWGGTVINSMLHFANEARMWRQERLPLFAECTEALIAAGADLSVVDYSIGVPAIDAVLDRHRPRP